MKSTEEEKPFHTQIISKTIKQAIKNHEERNACKESITEQRKNPP